MQYLLTEEEYAQLKQDVENAKKAEINTINHLCQMVADNVLVLPSSKECTDDKPKPYRCIHSVNYEWYCDGCTVRAVCRMKQHYSK